MKSRRVIKLQLCIALSCVLSSSIALSQETSASVSGVVTDTTGAVIPGVLITARNLDTTLYQTVDCNSSGFYHVMPLPPGHYSITARMKGFTTYAQLVTLTVNQAATVNFQLQVGSQAQTVTVSAGKILLNTTSAEISNLVDQNTIQELPLNGRDPSSLLFLSPGVTNILNTKAGKNQLTDAFNTESGGTAGGGEQGSTYALLDGIPNMDTYTLLMAPFPNPDATREFRAITNNFSVMYGFSPSAVISIDTNSGTNEIHGNVFEFLRNGALNAANWFSGAVDQLKRNQFGGSVGAPILKNKLFAFANYQATRQSLASGTETAFTPTSAMLNGDFSAVPRTLAPPFSTIGGKPNQINPDLFSKAAVAIAETALPLGQTPSTGEVIYSGPTVDSSFNEGTARMDYNMSDKLRFFARSFIQEFNYPAANINGNILASGIANGGRFYNEAISNTWLPNPRLVNTVTAAWVNMYVTSGSQVLTTTGEPFCLSNYINVAEPPGCYVEAFSTSGGFGTPSAEPNGNMRTTWWLTDNLTATVGNHVITAGINYGHQFNNVTTDYPAQPIIKFNGFATGYANADFLLGDVARFEQGASQNSPVRGVQFALYGQDQYNPRHNVTVTVGLRWEPDWAVTFLNGGASFVPGSQSVRYPQAPLGLIFPGDPGLSPQLRPSSNAYFAPRLSAAWQANQGTVVRGGFGIFIAPLSYSSYGDFTGVAPFAPLYTLSATSSSPISFQNPWVGFSASGGKSPFPPFEANPNIPASQAVFLPPLALGSVFAPNFRLPVTQSWTASIEQQLTKDLAFHLAYVGSQTYHVTTIIDKNPGIYASGGNRTTYPEFSDIIQDASFGTASYNSLQAGLEKKMSYGLEFDSNFTWSKTIDISSWGNTSFYPALPNPFNIKFNRGIADLNVPLVSVSSFVYRSPALNGRNAFLKNVGGAWEISGIWTFQSGFPFGIAGGKGNNNSGALQNGDRANYVPGQSYNVHQGTKSQWLNRYFNPLAFVPNPSGTFGDTGKNILKGPGMNTADIALSKNWAVYKDRDIIQFRWEMYNAFNHPNFGLPDNSPTDPNFGQITSTGAIPPRVVQVALKYSF